MAGRSEDDDTKEPWHNRTPEVVGASLVAIVAIGILIAVATAVAGQFGEPEEAPIDYIAPTYSATASEAATTGSTTQTITSTIPPETTDINPDSTSGSSTTSGSSGTSSERTPTRADDDEDDSRPTRTTRQRPRTNVTRTFSPLP